MEQNYKGVFIVVYGNNNIGKSTQSKLLVERIMRGGMPVHYVKYPVYDFAPTGPMINAYLREGNPHELSCREAQTLYAMNRYHFEPMLKKWLDAGDCVVAEDYVGTSLAWGIGNGVDKKYLLEINSGLLKEDITLFMDGQRFTAAKEAKHIHEQNDALVEKVGVVYRELAKEFGWTAVDVSGSIEEIHERMWNTLCSVNGKK
jgi:thymidylate kinase